MGLRDEILLALARPLPGAAAQEGMLPSYRSRPAGAPSGAETAARAAARQAAALILFYPDEGHWSFPLTLRREDLRHHGGQISLPGGALERGESADEAALREAEEEIGLARSETEVLGPLTPLFVPPSGFLIRPVIGLAARRPRFVAQESEVAEILEAPLDWLLDPASRRERPVEYGGRQWPLPYFALGRREVWGATAMILAELAELLSARTGVG